MENSHGARRMGILCLYFCIVVLSFSQCADARKPAQMFKFPTHSTRAKIKTSKKINALKLFGIIEQLGPSNTGPYGVSSPFSLPPYDSLAPIPLPENSPPYSILPPLTPSPPSATIPAPAGGGITPSPPLPPSIPTPSYPPLSPPPGPPGSIPSPNPPESVPSPPEFVPVPNPPPSPAEPSLSPPFYEPSPPATVPPPFGFVPNPPVFLPPVVYPQPREPPPPYRGPATALWCVAKPAVPDPIIQEAMDYACARGSDCDQIQPNGSCFEPNTLFAHASYAFNSFWQRTKAAGGTCGFGGTAILVSMDPSHDGCHFIYF